MNIAGEERDLSHLKSFIMQFESLNAQKKLKIEVRFSNHCYSSSESEDGPVINEGEDRLRFFCPIRYRLSLELPDLIRGLNVDSVKVTQTVEERNWVYTISIENPEGPYHIFFSISKEQKKHERKYRDLIMMVESAYHEITSSPNVKGKMKFHTLCTNVFLNKKVSTKK